MQSIGVIGGGAWGTALAQVFAKNGRDTTIWARETEVVSSINERHENSVFLAGIPLDKKLKATGSLDEIAKKDILVLVSPAQYVRTTLGSLKKDLNDKPVVICAKGIELNTGLLLSQVAEDVAPRAKIAILTGPTFAAEIARGLPGAVTLACADELLAKQLQSSLGSKYFRPYVTTDVAGAQVSGAVKNVIAIACGIIHGRNMGDSARAALVTRGLAEITRLSMALGGRRETMMGLCGIGDLMLTCSSMQSRNFSLGAALGEGKSLDEILGGRKEVTEGVYTAKATVELAKKLKVEMPVTAAVNGCLNESLPVDKAIEELLNRPVKDEN
ncbi:MAG: NAD(P)H-dependent glycerol-3-phosphate dehydrogenase [Alphaproteobacteria bacterium]